MFAVPSLHFTSVVTQDSLDFSLAGTGSLPRLLFWLGVLSALVKGLCQRNNNNKVKSFLDPPTTLSNTDIFFFSLF